MATAAALSYIDGHSRNEDVSSMWQRFVIVVCALLSTAGVWW
jgi:hypothetical protein